MAGCPASLSSRSQDPCSVPARAEGGTATYTVELTAQPTSDRTVTVESSDTGAATVAPTALTFTPSNWNVAQQVTVTGVADGNDDDEMVVLTHKISTVNKGAVAVTVQDNHANAASRPQLVRTMGDVQAQAGRPFRFVLRDGTFSDPDGDGREGALTVDGEVTTGLVGADWASANWTAGLALGHSTGTGGWRRGGACDLNCGGAIEATLSGLCPYAGVDLPERLSVWAAAGWGAGEVTVTPEGRPGLTADLSMSMGAAGVRSEVLRPEGGEGLALAVKGDARFTRTSSDAVRSEAGNLAAAEADVWLVRTGVEGSRPVALGEDGATLTPSFEVGLRLDGGDAETGMGADLGGGITFADPANGVALDAKARGLVAHESPGFREWGASLAASWDPRPATDRGLALMLTQSWGASPSGGMDALLSRETLADLAANDEDGVDGFRASSRLEGEVGYGVAMFGGAFTGTPNVGFGISGAGARDWRLTSAMRGDPGFEVSLDATRTEPANDARPEHGVMLRGSVRW